MNKRLIILSGFKIRLINIITILFLLCNCRSEDNSSKNKTETQQAEAPVTQVFSLKKGRISSSLQIPGELIAFQQVNIYAKENSFVKKLYVDVGSEVKEGDLLVTMEAPELGSQLAAAESAIKSREAIYLASKANYDRLLETSKTPGTISPNDLEQAIAIKSSDYAQLQAAESAHSEIMEMQKYLQIRAPFKGVITARNVNPGAYVGPSGKGSELPLFNLQEQKRLRLVLSVPESYTGYLNEKNEVSFTVKSQPGHIFRAAIKRMSGSIDDRLRSQRIEMDVINNDKKLLPGMVAEVNLSLPSGDSVFIVPRSAVINSTESVFVIRVVNNQSQKVDIKTGREANGLVEVYGNLKDGDLLLISASDEIKNGTILQNLKTVTL
ncbi:MAG TPA: efflux RND transporter periplasmic adaptor subunit [Puia sp.]|jgi:membrane fusion protein (multidrug efflux system)|nr:efflux RND transporter periplasmic adaptor subunit [Puia sp.]